jgi:hypothetical protein
MIKPFSIPHPIFIRFHFYPANMKTVGSKLGTGAGWGGTFPSRFEGYWFWTTIHIII